jgi:hypothetical protein
MVERKEIPHQKTPVWRHSSPCSIIINVPMIPVTQTKNLFLILVTIIQNTSFSQEVVRTSLKSFSYEPVGLQETKFDTSMARTCSLSIRDGQYMGRKGC